MKYFLLAILLSCSRAPQKKTIQKPACLTIKEMEASVDKVKELTTKIEIQDKRLSEVTRKNQVLTAKFQRLTESFEDASPQSLPKLQARREELTLEAAINNEEGKTIQHKLQRLKQQIQDELFKVNNSETCP